MMIKSDWPKIRDKALAPTATAEDRIAIVEYCKSFGYKPRYDNGLLFVSNRYKACPIYKNGEIVDVEFYTFGMEFKMTRESLGFSQKDIEDIYDIPRRTVQDWEADKSAPPYWCQKLILDTIHTDYSF